MQKIMASMISKFNNEAQAHQERQRLNPFSGSFSRSPSPRHSTDYGKPLAGSKTEERGKKAKCHILREVLDLCNCIHDVGVRNEQARCKEEGENYDPDHDIIVTFKEIFQIYTNINDKVVGLLIAAKKRGFIYFEKEILFQRQDDDVLIALIKPISVVRKIINKELSLNMPTPKPKRPDSDSDSNEAEEIKKSENEGPSTSSVSEQAQTESSKSDVNKESNFVNIISDNAESIQKEENNESLTNTVESGLNKDVIQTESIQEGPSVESISAVNEENLDEKKVHESTTAAEKTGDENPNVLENQDKTELLQGNTPECPEIEISACDNTESSHTENVSFLQGNSTTEEQSPSAAQEDNMPSDNPIEETVTMSNGEDSKLEDPSQKDNLPVEENNDKNESISENEGFTESAYIMNTESADLTDQTETVKEEVVSIVPEEIISTEEKSAISNHEVSDENKIDFPENTDTHLLGRNENSNDINFNSSETGLEINESESLENDKSAELEISQENTTSAEEQQLDETKEVKESNTTDNSMNLVNNVPLNETQNVDSSVTGDAELELLNTVDTREQAF